MASGSTHQEMVTWCSSRKTSGVIHKEKPQEPYSYSITSQDTTAMYRRKRNHLKLRQVPDTPASITTIVPQEDTVKDEQATFTPQTNDSIQPNEETHTTVQHISSRSTKGIIPKRYRIEQ